jgi:hypothetical protein
MSIAVLDGRPLPEPAWLWGSRALSHQPVEFPTEALLADWPEALSFRAVSRPAGGRLARLLGWQETVMAITLDDDGHAIVIDGHFPWWPHWPLARRDCLTFGPPDRTQGG